VQYARVCCVTDDRTGQAVSMRRRPTEYAPRGHGSRGFRFAPDVIMAAVRWCLRYGLSYRDVEELLVESSRSTT
jgi:hypothetical protein